MRFLIIAVVVGVLFGGAFLLGSAEAGGPDTAFAQVNLSTTQEVGLEPTQALIDTVDGAYLVDVIDSELVVDEAGYYMAFFAPQVGKWPGAPSDFQGWMRINGVDVDNSNVLLALDNNTKDVIVSQGVLWLEAGDAVSFWMQASNKNTYIEAINAEPNPLVPAHISTLFKIGD